MIQLALRHLRHHWRLNVGMMLCVTLACALLVSLSGQSEATAARELRQTLAGARPSERNLLITGSRYTFSEALYRSLQEKLRGILKERLVIRHATLPADPEPAPAGAVRRQAVAQLEVYSFSSLPESVRVVEGHLPAQVNLNEAQGSWRPPPIEAVVGLAVAEQSGYAVGDRVIGSKGYHRLDIVGIVDPLDPQADLWGEDLSAFTIETSDTGADPEGMALPLIIADSSMRGVFPDIPIFPHQVSWRVTLNHHLVSVDKAEPLLSDLINFQTQAGAVGATTSTQLVRLLEGYLSRLSRVRMALLLVTAQSLFFVLHTLTIFTSAMGDQSNTEMATLSARGASSWQIAGAFALQSLVLVLPAALVLGPGLAEAGTRLWALGAGGVGSSVLSPQAWLLSAAAGGLGWVALVLPVFLSARRGFAGWQRRRARLPQLSAAQKRYVDLYLLAFGGLLYWQLNRSGSFVMRAVAHRHLGNIALADPLLLVGPSLLFVAGAMVFLRAVPVLLRLVARLVRRVRGLVLPVGLSRLARDPLQASRVVLLISLTLGLMAFTRTFRSALSESPDLVEADALAQGIAGTLQLNELALVAFGVAAFLLAHVFDAQGRQRDFHVLRAMGTSARQWLTLLLTEGSVVLILGLLAGAIVGAGLSQIMIPYLAQALAEPLADAAVGGVLVDWSAIGHASLLLGCVYGFALLLLGLALGRTRVQRPLLDESL